MTKKQKRKLIQRILIAAIIVLLAVIAVLLFFWMKDRKRVLHTQVDLSERAAANAYIFLSQIEENGITYANVKEAMAEVKIDCTETPTKERGVYERKFDEGSVEKALQLAEEKFLLLYEGVLTYRLQAEGYTGNVDSDSLNRLMVDCYGISMKEYLKSQVTLLPTAEQLRQQYEGEVRYDQ